MNLKLRQRRLNLFKKMSYRSLPDLRLQVLSRSDQVNLDDNQPAPYTHTHTHTHTHFFSPEMRLMTNLKSLTALNRVWKKVLQGASM